MTDNFACLAVLLGGYTGEGINSFVQFLNLKHQNEFFVQFYTGMCLIFPLKSIGILSLNSIPPVTFRCGIDINVLLDLTSNSAFCLKND